MSEATRKIRLSHTFGSEFTNSVPVKVWLQVETEREEVEDSIDFSDIPAELLEDINIDEVTAQFDLILDAIRSRYFGDIKVYNVKIREILHSTTEDAAVLLSQREDDAHLTLDIKFTFAGQRIKKTEPFHLYTIPQNAPNCVSGVTTGRTTKYNHRTNEIEVIYEKPGTTWMLN
ncbi:hypothetical protein BDQ17DRAFT_1422473 [Cyathus striatus]|nr:hypothetical protein BDQ17DRAFT_1422473 [Cyathus striatus]